MKSKSRIADLILKYMDMLQEEEDPMYEEDDLFEDEEEKPKGKIKVTVMSKMGKKGK